MENVPRYIFSIMYTHVAWLSFSRLISIMCCEQLLIYFHRLPERKLLSGGVIFSLLCTLRSFYHIFNFGVELVFQSKQNDTSETSNSHNNQ